MRFVRRKGLRNEEYRNNSQESDQKSSNIEGDDSSDSFHDCIEELCNEYEEVENNMATIEPVKLYDEEIVKSDVIHVENERDDISNYSTVSFSRETISSPDIFRHVHVGCLFIEPRGCRDREVDDFNPEIQEVEGNGKFCGRAGTGGKGCISLFFYTSIFAFLLVIMWIFIGGV